MALEMMEKVRPIGLELKGLEIILPHWQLAADAFWARLV
jgi:hypothetical protein